MSNADPINIVRPRPTNTHISAVRERTRGESPGSYVTAKDLEAQEIASDILTKLDNPEILDAGQIAQLRAEVQRTLAQRLTIRDWAA